MGDITQNFSRSEFACNCCGELELDFDLPIQLQKVHEALSASLGGRRIRININSGYRCPKHNTAVGGSTRSQHLSGKAADIECFVLNDGGDWQRIHPDEVAVRAEEFFHDGGLGYYNTFTHVDTRGRRARWDNRS
tara:strand:+ start:679 stop:1083 length:405 start_codon:yes stop_codon:yes gene_type:complete